LVAKDVGNAISLGDVPEKKERDYQNEYGLSRQAIFNAVNASLARLETSYIDL
jgi:aryl-alcohol dehydrogenase-like predicted oxidoreductase